MKYKKDVFKALALITQLGINVMVPTFLCLLVGLWLSKYTGTWIVILLLFIGMAAGMRNCYVMVMSVVNEDSKANAGKGDKCEKERKHR